MFSLNNLFFGVVGVFLLSELWAQLLSKLGVVVTIMFCWLYKNVMVFNILTQLVVGIYRKMSTVKLIPQRPYAYGLKCFKAPRTMRWYLHQPRIVPSRYEQLVLYPYWKMLKTLSVVRILNVLTYFVLVISATATLYFVVNRLLKTQRARKLFLRYRFGSSVAYLEEALLVNSSLSSAVSMPGSQVRLMLNTADRRHVGFGIRVSPNIMVVPTHVWNKFVGLSVVFSGHTSVGVISYTPGVTSRLHADLTYVSLDPELFVKLGVKVATLEREVISRAVASVVGHNGVKFSGSNGLVTWMKSYGMVEYTGSTLPGYSGAAYIANGIVLGMHSGAQGVVNCGIAAGIISYELPKMILLEDTPFNTQQLMTSRVAEKTDSYKDLVDDAYDSEDEEDDIRRYNRSKKREQQQISPEAASLVSRLTNLSQVELAKVMENFKTLSYNGHSDNGEVTVVAPKTTTLFDTVKNIIQDLTKIHSRLDYIETELEKDYKWMTSKDEFIDNKLTSIFGRLSTVEKDLERVRVEDLEKGVRNPSSQGKVPEQSGQASALQEPIVQKNIEKKVDSVVIPPNALKTVKCTVCNRWFRTTVFQQQHVNTVHLKLESAFGEDTKRVVKTDKNFLVKGHSPLRKSRSSNDFSKLQADIKVLVDSVAVLSRAISQKGSEKV